MPQPDQAKLFKRIALVLGVAAIATIAAWPQLAPLFSSTPFAQQRALELLEQIGPVHVKRDDQGQVIEISANDRVMNDRAAEYLTSLPALQCVHLERSAITDAGLKHLAALPQLEAVYLDETAVTDAGLKQLAGCRQLQQLSLAGCEVSDAGMQSVGNLTQLTLLNISETNVGDAGVTHLQPLQKLATLYLKKTGVTGAGLKSIGTLVQLTHLDLSQTKVDQETILALAHFPKLELLYLRDTNLDDELVANLVAALASDTPNLRGLSIPETPLSDAAVEPLKGLAQLKHLAIVQLQETKISKQAFKQLPPVMPDVNFSVNYSERDE